MHVSISSTRKINTSIILQNIINNQPISRAQISEITGLNKATVSSIVKKLIENNIIIESGHGSSSIVGGRKPILLELNIHHGTVIAIEAAPTFIHAEMTYLNGETIFEFFQQNITVNRFNIMNIIDDIVNDFEEHLETTIGMTVAIHGITDNSNILFTPYYDLDKINLFKSLCEKYDFPIIIENEANIAAIGEYSFGLSSDNLISINVHTGIGAGIIIEGKIKKGVEGKAGEIGHSILIPNGRPCPCGNKGCLEQYASNKVICSQLKKIKKLDEINIDQISELYFTGDLKVINYLDNICLYLAIGINNLITIIDPESIVINNSLFDKIPNLIIKVKENIHSNFVEQTNIKASSLKGRSIILGAVSLTIQKHLNVTNIKIKP